MKVQSTQGSIAIGGDNQGQLFNSNIETGGVLNIVLPPQGQIRLSSLLGKVIVFFSRQGLADYGLGPRRELPPEVEAKIAHNRLKGDRLLREYSLSASLIEKSYAGVEQQNPDARRLVRRIAGVAYATELEIARKMANISQSDSSIFARNHSQALIMCVITRLLEQYTASNDDKVDLESAHLAVSLVVADAIIECQVLETPADAVTS